MGKTRELVWCWALAIGILMGVGCSTSSDEPDVQATADLAAEQVGADVAPELVGVDVVPEQVGTDIQKELVCRQSCEGKQCGDDGCGASCGECADELTCQDGFCLDVCKPKCDGKDCGWDGCTGTCGACEVGEECVDNKCVECDPDCDGKDCGSDGCGGKCGTCEAGHKCTDDLCVCVPDCDGFECGDDGCEGTCGECDDGNPCTADACAEGLCTYELLPLEELVIEECLCEIDDDCLPLDDEDICNGTLICVEGAEVSTCAVDAETVPVCADETPCTDDTCDPVEGCLFPNNDDNECADDDPCNGIEACVDGECTAGELLVCDDENVCTDDSCVEGVGCEYVNNDENACADADACNGIETCLDGECIAGEALVCDDQDVCTGVETCDPDSGCQLGEALACDDLNVCTDDGCDSIDGCVYVDLADETVCVDANFACGEGECVEGVCTDVAPADDTTCDGEDDDCDNTPDEDYVPTPTECGKGACKAAGELVCVDGSTEDTCEPLEAKTDIDDDCNGVDDDCDGEVDEDYPGDPGDCVSKSMPIGPEGGAVELDNGTKLEIPAGALDQVVEVSMGFMDAGDGDLFIQLEPEGLEFAQPASLTIQYTPGEDARNYMARLVSPLNPLHENGNEVGNWAKLELLEYDVDAGTGVYAIPHFSDVPVFQNGAVHFVVVPPLSKIRKMDIWFQNHDLDWSPGHVGMYFGSDDPNSFASDGRRIIHASPDLQQVAITPLADAACQNEKTAHVFCLDGMAEADDFFGFRRVPEALSIEKRAQLAATGVGMLGVPFTQVKFGPGLGMSNQIHCSGFVSLVYSQNGIGLGGLLGKLLPHAVQPYAIFKKTVPLDEITVIPDEQIQLRARALSWSDEEDKHVPIGAVDVQAPQWLTVGGPTGPYTVSVSGQVPANATCGPQTVKFTAGGQSLDFKLDVHKLTLTGKTPEGETSTISPTIEATLTDTCGKNLASAKITVDGLEGNCSGCFERSMAVGPWISEKTLSWTYEGELAEDKIYTVTVEGANEWGATFKESWSFSYAPEEEPPGPPVDTEVHFFKESLIPALGGEYNLVDFDDVDTSGEEPVLIQSDRYLASHGIVIDGNGEGQYVDDEFNWPDEYPPVSNPNIYAPGPEAGFYDAAPAGGKTTVVTFKCPDGKAGGVAGFGLYFIDADWPDDGPSSLTAYDKDGNELLMMAASGGNASQEFRAIVALDAKSKVTPGIYKVVIINGQGWPGNWNNEGVTLDDFIFGKPVCPEPEEPQ